MLETEFLDTSSDCPKESPVPIFNQNNLDGHVYYG